MPRQLMNVVLSKYCVFLFVDVHVTTINSIAKKYFCHYTYDMYGYVAIFFAFKFITLAIEFEENFLTSKRTIQQTVCCLVILQSSYKHSIIND